MTDVLEEEAPPTLVLHDRETGAVLAEYTPDAATWRAIVAFGAVTGMSIDEVFNLALVAFLMKHP